MFFEGVSFHMNTWLKDLRQHHCKLSLAPPDCQLNSPNAGMLVTWSRVLAPLPCCYSQINTQLPKITEHASFVSGWFLTLSMRVITGSPQSGKHLYWLDTVMDVFTHRRPLPGTPLATGAKAGGGLWGAGQVGAVWFVSHSSLGISAADITRSLPLATGHRALEDMRIETELG